MKKAASLLMLLAISASAFSQTVNELESKKVTLTNGWSLTPVGRSFPLGDLPLNIAVSKFLKLLGITISLPHVRQEQRNAEFGHPIKISSEFGMLEHFQIYGVNPKSDTRPRTSIVLARRIGSHTQYFLMVRGEQTGLKGLLEMSDTEQTTFRNLMVQYREQNLIRIIYAYKRLTKDEVTSYVSQYSGIVKSRKYDV